MPKLKLDFKKIKELVISRSEILGLVLAGVFVAVSLLISVSVMLDAESPAAKIQGDADKINRDHERAKQADTKAGPKAAQVWKWDKVTPHDVQLTATAQFEAGAAGSSQRTNPRILTVDNSEPNGGSFQMDYIHHGVHTYEFPSSQEKLNVFTGEKKEPVVVVAARRLIVVTGTFPYHEQVEEYAKALRLDKNEDVFLKQLAPAFEGLNVERRKITKKDGQDVPGEWVKLYYFDTEKEEVEVNAKIKEMLKESVYDNSQVKTYQDVIYGSSVTPLPLLTHNIPYPPVKLAGIANRDPSGKNKQDFVVKDLRGPNTSGAVILDRHTFGVSRPTTMPNPSAAPRGAEQVGFDLLEPSLRDQVSGNINWFSPFGTFAKDPSEGQEDPNKTKPFFKAPPVDPNAPPPPKPNFRAPMSLPPNPKALVRFVDVDMEPNAIYQYRVQARFANPNYGQAPGMVAHSGLSAVKELTSFAWVETPMIYVPPDESQYYITNQDKVFVSKLKPPQKTIDRTITNANAGDKMVPFQVQRFVGAFSYALNKEGSKTYYVGDWVVAERLVVARGETIGRDCEVEMVIWDKFHSQWQVSGLSLKPPDPKKFVRDVPTGLMYNFRTEPPVVLLDFAGGARQYKNPKTKFDSADESAVQALLLMPDMTMRVRNGQDDSRDDMTPMRKAVFDAWRDRLETLATPPAPAAPKKR
jgi:hypothetical protein